MPVHFYSIECEDEKGEKNRQKIFSERFYIRRAAAIEEEEEEAAAAVCSDMSSHRILPFGVK